MPKLAWASVQAVCPSAASGLIVKPSGRVTVAALISEGEAARAEELGSAQLDVEARGRVGFGRGRAGVEDRVEDLQVAAGRRRVVACLTSSGCRGPGRSALEAGGQRRPGAGGRVVGERVRRDARRSRGARGSWCRPARGSWTGSPGSPLGKRWASWLDSAGKPQKVRLAPASGVDLGDVLHGEAQAVVAAGAHRDRDVDRDVQSSAR